jgi:hypothetical protein
MLMPSRIRIREEALGLDHPEVAPVLNKPGGLLVNVMEQLTLMSRPEAYLQDLQMMKRCLEVAQRGAKQGELPFGALIVFRGQVHCRGDKSRFIGERRDAPRGARGAFRGTKEPQSKVSAGLYLVFDR